MPTVQVKSNPKRRDPMRRAVALAILTITSVVLMSTAESLAAQRQVAAYAARLLNGTATAHLHLVKAEGSQLFEEGQANGALQGWMRAELNTGATFEGSFAIRVHGGSIKGQGTANPHGSGRYQSFSGSITVKGGSGRYIHAHGHAGLYGTLDRRTYALVVQTTGKLSY